MKKIVNAAAACAFCLSPLAISNAAEGEHQFARDIKILTDWFEGDFDNEEQLWFHGRSKADGEAPIRVHTIHRRLDLPAFGEHVFYVEEYKDNNPEDIIRQRFVTFEADLEAGAIRMQQGFFRDGEKYLGAYDDPKAFSKLKLKDVFFMKDIAPDNQCDVFWRRVADQFEGKMIEKGCRLGTTGEGPPRYSVHDLTLSPEKYWRVDVSLLAEDDSLYRGEPLDRPTQMRRADLFQCEGSFRTDEGVQTLAPFTIHNQGGTANITRDADNQSFDILMRKKEYPFYETRPDFLYFSIREEGAAQSLVYTVNDIASRRVGVSHAGMSVHCHRDGYEFRESLDAL